VLNEIATRPHLNIHVQNMWQNGYPPPISIKLTMNTRFQSMLVTWQQVDEPNIAPNNLYLQKYQTLEVYVQNILVAKESNIDMSQQNKTQLEGQNTMEKLLFHQSTETPPVFSDKLACLSKYVEPFYSLEHKCMSSNNLCLCCKESLYYMVDQDAQQTLLSLTIGFHSEAPISNEIFFLGFYL
jgi:hypothetical protein